MSKTVLGKGLGALIPAEQDISVDEVHYRVIPLDRIAPNPMQPRQQFDEVGLAELAESVRQNGLVQPLVVRRNGGGYTLVAGERRYRAARMAGLEKAPAVIMDDIDDVRMLELALVENIQRQDLNPLELADAYRRLIEQCGLTQQQLAQRVGRSRAAVANHLRLLSLPDSIKRLIADGRLTEGHARALLALDNESRMLEMAERIVSNSLSVREAEQAAPGKKKRRRLEVKRLSPALADIEADLKRRLATSVKIMPGLRRGRIEIEYYGEDDLSRLWQLFRKIDS
ncbi:MAG: ParB/RepB/Spo0J family partition protein [Candidatus Zixiibacteriota bacterium]